MTTEGSPDEATALRDRRVIDAGAQVQETVDDLLTYMDAETAAREFLDLSNNPRGDVYGGVGAHPLYEYKRAGADGVPAAEGDLTEAIGFDAVERQCAAQGIDAAVVNPTLNLDLAEVNNDRFAVALASAYNDWLLDGLDGRDRLVGNVVVAPQHPERAAAEIDRVGGEAAVAGVHLPVTGVTHPLGHRAYDPIYAAAEDHGLPIVVQPTVGASSLHQQFYESAYFAQDYVMHQPFLALRHLTSLMFEGVPVRYPDLDVVLLDCGVGWAPYAIMRLDDHYLELGYEIPALNKLPSEYAAESVYWGTGPVHDAGTHPDSRYLARAIKMVGPDNVLFTSDLPHPRTDTPAGVDTALGDQLDADAATAVFSGTAARVFGL